MAPVIDDDRIDYRWGDLTERQSCVEVTKDVDYVFMCAANSSGAGVMATTPLAHVTPNVVMNALMLEAAHEADVRKFCFVSSNCVYPPMGRVPAREEDMMNGEPHEAYFTAGWMKRYSEILCQTYAQKIDNKMPVLVVRPTNAYGPFDDFRDETSHMTAALIRRVAERQDPINVWGTGEDVKDLIFVSDLVEGMIRAFRLDRDYLALNIGSGRGYSVREVIDTIARVGGQAEASVQFDPSKPSVIPIRLVSVDRAKALTGFTATTSLESGIRQTLSWLQCHRDAWVKV